MSTIGDDAITTEQGRFCPSCGEAAGAGRYCPGCGTAIPLRVNPAGQGSVSTNSTGTPGAGTASFTPAAGAPARRKPGRAGIIAAAVLGVVAIAIAAVILATGGSKARAKPAAVTAAATTDTYQTQLAAALHPVLGANQTLSQALGAMDGSPSANRAAQRAVSAAQAALLTARGAIGATNAPGSDQTLSNQVQQALDDEGGYLTAVSDTLTNPSSSQAGQLQTLSTSLQSALVPLGAVISGASGSVSGASNLTSWANSASHPPAQHSSSGSSSASASSAAASNPYAGMSNCGGGLYAGPNTSCPFAVNTQQAYNQAPGADATVQVYSPVTNQTYTMSCAPAGSGVTCSGANNASVSW